MEISISILYRKITGETLTEQENKLFSEWYSEREEHRIYWEHFCRQQEKIWTRQKSVVDIKAGFARLRYSQQKVRKRIMWIRCGIAASIILLAGISGGLYHLQTSEESVIASNDIPKRESVILKLSDGENIVLTNIPSTMTVGEKQASIQVEAGILRYQVDSISEKIEYNELNVPVAGEYQVVLSDGTKVFLNSSSSLRYPVVFSKKERRVYLEGEAFFEVTHGEIPFIVETRIEEIKVFGTEFNVMTYTDEQQMQTTLVKGSIGVRVKANLNEDYVKLTPGEQFLIDNETGETKVREVDVFPYIAWKDGLFVSQNDCLETIMIKVSRWFNVKIFYQNPDLKKKRFWGIMKKQNSLKDILEIIEKAGNLKCSVNGNTVVVSE